MTSGYGSWVNHARYRWDLSYSPGVSAATGTVKARLRIWYQTDGWRIDDPSTTLTVTGSFSTSQTVYVKLMAYNVSSQEQLIFDRTISVSTRYGAAVKVSFSASHSGAWNNMNPSASGSISIPARPYSAPSKPTSVAARRVSDSQVTVSFTTASTTAAPVTSTVLERATDGGGFSALATVSGTGAKTFTDNGVTAGHYYQYRVTAKGKGGSSPAVTSVTVYTTPHPPTDVSAVNSGMDIRLAWVNNARGQVTNRIYEDTSLIANLAGNATSFLIAAPNPSYAHAYSVVAVTPDGLESSKALSNQVQLAVAPHAPTGLSPNSAYIPTGTQIPLTWTYNSGDTSEQSRYEIQTATNPDSPDWVTLKTSVSDQQETTVPAGDSARTIVWRVRTWGQDENKPSPFSEPARIDIVVPPTITVSDPPTGAVVDKNSTHIRFGTTSGEVPLYWEARLLDNGIEVDTGSGIFQSRTGSWNVSGLENGHTYQVRARAGGKVWSPEVSRSFSVTYAAPALPHLEATWQHEVASVQLEIINPAKDPPVDFNIVQRSDGSGFVTIAKNVLTDSVLIDHTPPLNTDLFYRVIAVSALGTQSLSSTQRVPKPAVRGIWLNWGIDGSRKVHLVWNAARSTKPERVYANEYVFAGHTLPTLVVGDAIRRETTISAYLGKSSDTKVRQAVALLDEAALTNTPVIVRRAEHGSLSGYISGISMPMDERGTYTVNLSHIQTDNQH